VAVVLNPEMVIRESVRSSLFSIVNLISPAFSRIQNLRFLGDISFPLKTIEPCPPGSVEASKTNEESVCAYNGNNESRFTFIISPEPVHGKHSLTKESSTCLCDLEASVAGDFV